MLLLYESGKLVMDYNSCPDYFNDTDDEPAGPAGADPQALCRALDSPNVDDVSAALDAPEDFAESTLQTIVHALALPAASALASYSRIELAKNEPELVSPAETGLELSTVRRTP